MITKLDPVSVVRYKVDTIRGKIFDLSYRSINKSLKLDTIINENTKEYDVVITYTNSFGMETSIPIGPQFEHRLYFYKNITENRDSKPVPLKIKKNKTDKVIDIPIEFCPEFSINVPLDLGYTAVYYPDYLAIFNNKQIEVCRYVVADDGLYQLMPTKALFTYIDKNDGSSSGTFKLDIVMNHDDSVPILNHVIAIGKQFYRFAPANSEEFINFDFDTYGLQMNQNCGYYSSIDGATKTKFYTSCHELYYDNFDYNLHYNDNLICSESFFEDGNAGILEYIRFIYKGNKEKDIKVLREPLNYENICKAYFN